MKFRFYIDNLHSRILDSKFYTYNIAVTKPNGKVGVRHGLI